MARQMNRLTARTVASISDTGMHADGGGLYLNVKKNSRSWSFVFFVGGKRRELGLGSLSTVSLAEARKKADEARRLVAAGGDPIAEREADTAEARVPTFGAMADRYIEAMEAGWRNPKHRDQWRMTLGRTRDADGKLTKKGYCLDLANKRVDEITTEDVLKVLKPIWSKKPETANRIRGRIEMVLDAAKVAGHRTGENPAAWRGHLALILPKRSKLSKGNHAAMAYGELPKFMAKLREAKGLGALALEFTILTAARSGETRGATWSEIDPDAKLWKISAARMKAGKEHRVPLTDRALAIIDEVAMLRRPIDGDDAHALVFPSTKPGKSLSDMTLSAVLRRMELNDVTVHGFRSSFRDWAGDETHYPRDVIEQALAHTLESKTEAAYRRGDALEKRRKLMEAWEAFCFPSEANNVVFITSGREAG
ncbi:DUF4102 domain-containing protein [Ochrobactrum pseudogrignonense]|uniref:DUF4102 domain-containing protein n=1 Tax=Brucella pseudogrignonensis TaxID=419475 RepID=A0A7Y3T1U5_9HYPH|nr:integrase arm-type DNA-binding domain-containing protein [Brucella pseudogrignonensis]NNV19521.1 DUF4102 domain-containing protein [Brucella pseudogrignonensis]